MLEEFRRRYAPGRANHPDVVMMEESIDEWNIVEAAYGELLRNALF